jgi:hypothetical protein
MEAARLDRLQWWWQLSTAQERGGETALKAQRQEAVDRFRQHIERWLINSQHRLTGGEPFPQLERIAASPVVPAEPPAKPAYVETVREHARMTAGR